MTEKEEIGSKSISFRATKEDMVIIRRFQEREEKAGIRKATEADVLRRGLRLVDEGMRKKAGSILKVTEQGLREIGGQYPANVPVPALQEDAGMIGCLQVDDAFVGEGDEISDESLE